MMNRDIERIRAEAAALAAADSERADRLMHKLEAARAALLDAQLALRDGQAPTAANHTRRTIDYTLDIIMNALHKAGARS